MRPTFSGVRRLAVVCWGDEPDVGDVVVAQRPDRPDLRIIKRITSHDARGWWLESDAHADGVVRSDSWLFGPVDDNLVIGVVRWPQVRR